MCRVVIALSIAKENHMKCIRCYCLQKRQLLRHGHDMIFFCSSYYNRKFKVICMSRSFLNKHLLLLSYIIYY